MEREGEEEESQREKRKSSTKTYFRYFGRGKLENSPVKASQPFLSCLFIFHAPTIFVLKIR